MSYLYGKRAQIEAGNPVSEALKLELYCQEYDTINWNKARNECANEDLYYPHPMLQDVLWGTLSKVEPILLRSPLRKWANREALKHVVCEDENTRYVDIGPVNKVFNCLCRYFSGDAEGVEKHMPRFWDYLWVAEDGMKMQGYNDINSGIARLRFKRLKRPGWQRTSTSVCATPLSISTTVS